MKKESVNKFDLEAAFKALNEIEIPVVKGVKPNRENLKEKFTKKLVTDILVEDYFDVNDSADLEKAQEEREAEVAKAKLARIEKIVDLDAESGEDLLPSYVGKLVIQCPQCMTLFYKKEEDIEKSEENPDVVNLNEPCQHCGNNSGYTLIGKVAQVGEDEAEHYDVEHFEDELNLDFPAGTEETNPYGTGEDVEDKTEEETAAEEEKVELEPVEETDEENSDEENSEEEEEEVKKESLNEAAEEELLDDEDLGPAIASRKGPIYVDGDGNVTLKEDTEEDEVKEVEEIVTTVEEVKEIAAEAGEEVAEVVKENPEVEPEEIKEVTDEVVTQKLEEPTEEVEEVVEDEISEEEVKKEAVGKQRIKLNNRSLKEAIIDDLDDALHTPGVWGVEFVGEECICFDNEQEARDYFYSLAKSDIYRDSDGIELFKVISKDGETDTIDVISVYDEEEVTESLTEDFGEELTDFVKNNYRVALADYEDSNGYDQEDVEYILKPGQTKGDLVVYLSDRAGFIGIYVHDERLATDEEIKHVKSDGFETVKLTGAFNSYEDFGEVDEEDWLKESLTEAVDKELDDKLKAHNEYIEYLKEMIEKEEKSLANAKNDFVKKSIQSRIDALKADLEAALPEALKNEVVVNDELPTPEEAKMEDAAENKEEKEETKESLTEAVRDLTKIEKTYSHFINDNIKDIYKAYDEGFGMKAPELKALVLNIIEPAANTPAKQNFIRKLNGQSTAFGIVNLCSMSMLAASKDTRLHAWKSEQPRESLVAEDVETEQKLDKVEADLENSNVENVIVEEAELQESPVTDALDKLIVDLNEEELSEDVSAEEFRELINDPVFKGTYKENLEEDIPAVPSAPFEQAIDRIENAGEKLTPEEQRQEDEELAARTKVEKPDFDIEEVEDFNESAFNTHAAKYLKEVYSNVVDFETTSCSVENKKLVVEGTIKFNSGKTKTTKFVFENVENSLKGINTDLAEGYAFQLNYNITNKEFITESIKYSYNIENTLVEGFTR